MAVPIAALVAVGQAGYQAYKGHQQEKKAKKLKQSNYVPPALEEAIVSSRMEANSLSPGYNRAMERARRSTGNTLTSAKRIGGSASQIQQTLVDSDAREKEISKDIEVAESANRTMAKRNLQGLLVTKGGFQKQSKDALDAAKSALIGAGEQNKYNAVTNLAEGIVNSVPDNTISSDGTSTGTKTTTSAATVKKPLITKNGRTLPDLSKGVLTEEQLRYLMGIGKQKQFYTGR